MSDAVMRLADGFDLANREQWMSLVDAVLRGASFDKTLTYTTYDGIQIQPLYTAADHSGDNSLPGQAPFTRGDEAVGGGWQIRQAHSSATGNQAVLDDIASGADAIELHLNAESSLLELEKLLDGVPTSVPVTLASGSVCTSEALLSFWEKRGVPNNEPVGGFGLSPTDPNVAEVVAKTVSLGFGNLQVAQVNAAGLADQGATEAQELAGSLADGVSYLRACEHAGLDLAAAVQKLEFRYSAGVDQFLTIAKLRAARRLWARVTQACGIEPVAQRQHAVTAGAMMTRHDSWVNMIRTTVACFAAAAGGANAITVSPFDAAIGVPDSLGLRIAKNTQLLLREESHIGQVIDPAGGSYYVEWLTDALASTAWGLFQELEAGASLSTYIAVCRTQRSADVATRKLPLTGVSEFPNLGEELFERAPWPDQQVLYLNRNDQHRLARSFEILREAAHNNTKNNSAGSEAGPPQVFLACLGTLAAYTARCSFASNLLAAGGIKVVQSESLTDAASAAQAWAASGCSVAVVCSSDTVYQDQGALTVGALKDAGCGYVLVAGQPDERWDADGYIHIGCNVLSALQEVHKRLGL